jgi:Nuclease-related domain/Topoisomerase DNA binding C4 zinc finger
MPKTYHTAAKSTREMADERRKQLSTVGWLVIGAVIIVYILLTNSSSLRIGGIGILVLLFAIRLLPDWFDGYSHRKEKTIRRADRGADAEEQIADLLNQLGDEFVVIHDVDSSYGNIDHIVISQKGGIFLLETKSHHGIVTTTDSQILVNGEESEKDFIAQALQNSYWLREEIGRLVKFTPWITPVVVFTNAFVKYGKPVKGVKVINRKFLLRTIEYGQSSSHSSAAIWANRDLIAGCLTGKINLPDVDRKTLTQYCPKCGKKLVEKVAKGGSQVGKRFMVCPDYPKCKTAIPIE